jgi:hypothetical protein
MTTTATDIHGNQLPAIEIKIRKSKGEVILLSRVGNSHFVQSDGTAVCPAGCFGPLFAENSNFPRFFDTRSKAADFMVAKFRRIHSGREIVGR